MPLLELIEKGIDYYFAAIPRKKPKQESVNNARLIAHRGAHDKNLKIIENTHAAFKRALDLGCWGIEFDIQTTSDGVLVVNHDPNLSRLWEKDILISELTFEALRQLVPEIPSLAEVIEHYGRKMHLFIELKAPFHAENALIAELKSLKPCEDYHLLSLDESIFASFSQISSETMLLVAGHNNINQFCRYSLEKKYGGVLGHYLLLNSKHINGLKSAKQHIGVGFVDSKFSLYRELDRDIFWLFSNNIGRVSRELNALQMAQK